MGQITSHGTEEVKGRNNVGGRESLEAKGPIVSSGTVDEDESIAIATNDDTVPKRNIHVDSVEVTVSHTIKTTTMLDLWNGGIKAKGGWKLTAINPLVILTDLNKMLVVAKLAAAHNTMELFRGPMSFGVG